MHSPRGLWWKGGERRRSTRRTTRGTAVTVCHVAAGASLLVVAPAVVHDGLDDATVQFLLQQSLRARAAEEEEARQAEELRDLEAVAWQAGTAAIESRGGATARGTAAVLPQRDGHCPFVLLQEWRIQWSCLVRQWMHVLAPVPEVSGPRSHVPLVSGSHMSVSASPEEYKGI